MNLHTLYIAILNGDKKTIDRLVSPLVNRLVMYLVINKGAEKDDARDVVQNTLIYVFQRIREKKILDPERLYHYLLVACRHSYFRLIHDRKRYRYDIAFVREVEYSEPQLDDLLKLEKSQILDECVAQLLPGQRSFYNYLITHPDLSTEQVAQHFGISVNNVWVRKHRLISILSKCVSERLKQ